METIGEQKIFSFAEKSKKALPTFCTAIRRSAGHKVSSFMELATKVAELQFMNRDFVLLFRGQKADYKNNRGSTTLKPSLLRATNGINPDREVLAHRFNVLRIAEEQLSRMYSGRPFLGRERLNRQQILRWSILQHYEICQTPLLDVTHSLRVAASFASDGAQRNAFIFVIGVPNLSGAITASAEAGIQIVRLSSVCPPTALRPHIQEGYLLGEYPEMTGYDQKSHYAHFEIDFGRRLIAKFRLNPKKFWKNDAFPIVERPALYPNDDDPLYQLAQGVQRALPTIAPHCRKDRRADEVV
jgi:hypothetical protein